MNCDGFRKGLSQTAASGGEPMGTAREHVNSCPSCKAAFVRECVLFGLIDAGLRAAVNCEIPRGLLQRIRPVAKTSNYRTRKLGRATKRDTKMRS
jgi:hypothetical protein